MKKNNIIKILSLAVGLTIGLVLIAKVRLELNYDACIQDKENVYKVSETFSQEGQGSTEYGSTPGGVVPVMMQYVPEIVTGTRYTTHFVDSKIETDQNHRYEFRESMFADTCFFDIFSTRILQGNSREILDVKGQCLISERLFKKMGNDAVGKSFCFQEAPDRPMTIAGVFQNFDENTSFSQLDIIMSMPSLGTYSWDGTQNLLGNDRYKSFVRLQADADIKMIEAKLAQMVAEVLPMSELKEMGFTDAGLLLTNVAGLRFRQDSRAKTTCIILLIVAIVMLFTAIMNYILVVISQLVGNTKQVAVRKCLGAPDKEFYLRTLKESSVHLAAALAIMALFLFVGKNVIKDLMGVSVGTLISSQTILLLVAVCVIVLLCCGLMPGYLYSRIPVTYAYRQFRETKRTWKLCLLAFQFVLSTMLFCVLATTYRQYDYMLGKDMGYEYDNLVYVYVGMLDGKDIYNLAREMETLPCVESASAVYSLLCEFQNGDNVELPDDSRAYFNYANLLFQEYNIVQTMGLELVRGEGFSQIDKYGWRQEAIVDENFAGRMKETLGWDDVIGKQIINSSIGKKYPLTIVGVVKDFTVGTLLKQDARPIIMANGSVETSKIVVRLNNISKENILALQQICDRLHEDADLRVNLYSAEFTEAYQDVRNVRNLIGIGCLAALLITLVGLIGYIRDEVQRRMRELAIRKVLGAGLRELQALFLRSIAVIALPAVALGLAFGYYLSRMLLQQFPDKVALLWWPFALVALIVGAIAITIVLLLTYRAALKNPVENIKTE